MQIYVEDASRTQTPVSVTTDQLIDLLRRNLEHLTIGDLTRLKASLVALDKSIYFEIKDKMESPSNKYKVVI